MSHDRPALAARGSANRSAALAPSAATLPEAQRHFFEARFGADFSRVQVHADTAAAGMAGALGAKAFASGEHIVFGAGHYQPGSTQGQALLAHELAHVAQQQRGGSGVGGGGAQVEPRARAAAQAATRGGSVDPAALGSAEPGIHCDPDDDKKPPADMLRPTGLPVPSPMQLTTPGPIDWLKLRGSYDTRGLRLGPREAGDIEAQAGMIANQLSLLGIRPGFKLDYKLGTLTYADLINIGLGKQIEGQLSRENPNSRDLLDQRFDQAYPGGFTIPPSILSKTWTF